MAALAELGEDLPTFVVAAGKAAWPMYRAFAEVRPVERVVVATVEGVEGGEGGEGGASAIHAYRAGHPDPNAGSLAAATRALSLAQESASRGGLTVLLSGGASAMLAAPVPGLDLQDKVRTAGALMSAGAAIDELNCVRKHLSRIKGGQLARAAGRTVTLALSDVHGPVPDDPSVIASGPTAADATTFADALDVLRTRRVDVPARVLEYLRRGARGEVAETVKPHDASLNGSAYRVIGNRHTAMDAAARAAEDRGYHVLAMHEATSGEASVAAADFVSRARDAARRLPRPWCVLASGETTVTVRGTGRGGRNQEFALAAVPLIASGGAMVLGSAGTDGIDGPTDAAGAVVDTETLPRSARLGLDWRATLARNDAYTFFAALNDLIVWGPTGTNVGDLHVILSD